jgi:uncharacterized membrane protein YeaQ/YmgE (transglycosylase-associated protein family)
MILEHLLIFLLVGTAAGVMAERLTNRTMPYGWLGAIAAGLAGAWLMTDGLHFDIAPQLSIRGVPVVSAIVGAAIVVSVFSVVTGEGRFSYRRVRAH